jgi:hypothetical protein
MAIVGTGPLGFSANPRHRLEASAPKGLEDSAQGLSWVLFQRITHVLPCHKPMAHRALGQGIACRPAGASLAVTIAALKLSNIMEKSENMGDT